MKNKLNQRKLNKSGFTLFELLVAVCILGILSVWITAVISYAGNVKKNQERKATAQTMVNAAFSEITRCAQNGYSSLGGVTLDNFTTQGITQKFAEIIKMDGDADSSNAKYTVIWLEKEDGINNLYLAGGSDKKGLIPSGIKSCITEKQNCKIASNVTKFECKYVDGLFNTIKIDMEVTIGNVSYESSTSVRLLND